MQFADINAFIDLVKNPDRYAEILKTLEEREARWVELVEAHTKLTNVDKFVAEKKAEAEAHVAKAEQTLKEAEDAKNQILAHTKEMSDMTENSKAEQVKAEAEAKQLVKENKQLQKELQAKQVELDSGLKAVSDNLAAMKVREQELSEKLEKLKAIAA